MLVVVALGGKVFFAHGEAATARLQRRRIRNAAAMIAEVIDAGHRVVVTHGNGPQVGLLASQSEVFKREPAFPLDMLGTETEGMIGHLLEHELRNASGGDGRIATLLTQIEVDAEDPSFLDPVWPVGPAYTASQAETLSTHRGWTMLRHGRGWRRGIASPKPRHILEIEAIRRLVKQDVTVICAGGGIPVIRRPDKLMVGVEAIVNKDLASAVLAAELDADALLMLTDVPGVCVGWGTGEGYLVRRAVPHELMKMTFEEGTMRPKVEAACRFARQTGGLAAIGALKDAALLLEGRAGTIVLDPKRSIRRAYRQRARPPGVRIGPPPMQM
ncbi:MAG: carbamate kinase [Pseudomonadota bacterium]